jgi:hypothetical protein
MDRAAHFGGFAKRAVMLVREHSDAGEAGGDNFRQLSA